MGGGERRARFGQSIASVVDLSELERHQCAEQRLRAARVEVARASDLAGLQRCVGDGVGDAGLDGGADDRRLLVGDEQVERVDGHAARRIAIAARAASRSIAAWARARPARLEPLVIPRSASTIAAVLRPGTPVTPPPGCVPAPLR